MAGSVTKLGHQQERKPHVLRGFWRGKHVRQQQTAADSSKTSDWTLRGHSVEPQFALAATTSLLNVKTIVWYGVGVK
jgi:threonine/homoserine/homoserine lactone efflux protein